MATEVPRALASLLELPEDERRLGPFVLLRQLGRGGFAPVWLAKEVYGATEVRTAAVKLFALGGADDGAPGGEAAIRREHVIQETRALCQVEHPNIVRFYTLLIDEARGVVGLAMEYVKGVGLDERLAEQARLSVRDVLDAGIAVASALAAVHRAGLVHRDVKPGNVIDATGQYKLIDFGISSAETHARPRSSKRVVLDDLPLDMVGTKMSTLAGSVVAGGGDGGPGSALAISTGTLGYIDPATIADGAPAAPASDLYGLGALLFECLTGMLPAMAGGARGSGVRGEVLDGRAHAASVRSVEAAVPEDLARLVDALLEPERAARPASAEEVARELERIRRELEPVERGGARDDAGSATKVSSAHAPPPPPEPTPATAARGDERSPTRPAGRRALGAIGIVGIAAAALFALMSRKAEAPPAPPRDTPPPSAAAPLSPPPVASAAPAARCPEGMALIPGGAFQMGSPAGRGDDDEHPRHAVTLATFCMDLDEVTVASYAKCVETKQCNGAGTGGVCNAGRPERENHPVNCVDWADANAYCEARAARLPTEQEWEYAAAGGDEQRTYPWGNDPPSIELCWNGPGNDLGKGNRRTTCPVGKHRAGRSRWGLEDLAGNAWEWTSSAYCPYEPAPCPDRTKRAIRGGGWFNDDATAVRVVNRYRSSATERFVGFRCASALSP